MRNLLEADAIVPRSDSGHSNSHSLRYIDMAACRMGYSTEEVLFLDDNLNACQTAKKAGMNVCGVYDDSSKEYAHQIKAASDYYIGDFSRLLEII